MHIFTGWGIVQISHNLSDSKTHTAVFVDQYYSGKKSIIELSFNMAMIKEWIKPHSSKIWRLEHAMAYAIGYIKWQSVFCLFWQTWPIDFKKWRPSSCLSVRLAVCLFVRAPVRASVSVCVWCLSGICHVFVSASVRASVRVSARCLSGNFLVCLLL